MPFDQRLACGACFKRLSTLPHGSCRRREGCESRSLRSRQRPAIRWMVWPLPHFAFTSSTWRA